MLPHAFLSSQAWGTLWADLFGNRRAYATDDRDKAPWNPAEAKEEDQEWWGIDGVSEREVWDVEEIALLLQKSEKRSCIKENKDYIHSNIYCCKRGCNDTRWRTSQYIKNLPEIGR